MRPARLCIYYGWPSAVNGSGGSVSKASTQFLNCDVLVLGDGLEHPSHGDHQATASIIATMIGAGRQVFGYVDLGVSTQNLSIDTIKQYVDEWRAMGASGIFFDDAGYDYGVTRARQNAAVDYVHLYGMKVFMNAWVMDDVLSDFDQTGSYVPSRVGAGDWYLAESWLISGGKYQSLSDWAAKADRGLAYARAKGVRIAAISTTGLMKALATDSGSDKFKMAWWGAAMYGVGAWQWTDIGYSSGDNVLRSYNTSSKYGTSFVDAAVSHSFGGTTHTRRTNTGTITVRGDGSLSGTGSFR